MDLFYKCLIVGLAAILYVAISTVRMVLTVKGKKVISSFLGFVGILIWFYAISESLSTNNGVLWIAISYALGFSLGTYIGSWIEEQLPIGTSYIQVVIDESEEHLIKILREKGFAVSVMDIKGKDKPKLLLVIEVKRRETLVVEGIIKEHDPTSFITIFNVNRVVNGYFSTTKG